MGFPLVVVVVLAVMKRRGHLNHPDMVQSFGWVYTQFEAQVFQRSSARLRSLFCILPLTRLRACVLQSHPCRAHRAGGKAAVRSTNLCADVLLRMDLDLQVSSPAIAEYIAAQYVCTERSQLLDALRACRRLIFCIIDFLDTALMRSTCASVLLASMWGAPRLFGVLLLVLGRTRHAVVQCHTSSWSRTKSSRWTCWT